MHQQPAGSRIFGEMSHAPDTPSSNVNTPNNNFHLTNNLRIRSIHSANYYLPPPPSYYSSHLIQTIEQSEPKYLSNWNVIVKNIKLEQGDTSLIAALSGTLFDNDRQTILCESYDAGRLDFIISKNIVKTNNGVFHLLGPISQGYPNNLYRACLEAEGIPRTWKYVLTQFTGKLPGDNKSKTSTTANTVNNTIGMGVIDLIKSYRVLRHLAIIAEQKLKEHNKARKSVSFVRHQFQNKLIYTLRIVNNQIIMGLKAILKNDRKVQKAESKNKIEYKS